jgi:hypothetical protein
LARRDGAGGSGQQIGEMAIGVRIKQLQQTLRFAARQFPQIGRTFSETFQQRVEDRMSGEQRLQPLGLARRERGKPFGDTDARGFRVGQFRRGDDAVDKRGAGGRFRCERLTNWPLNGLFGHLLGGLLDLRSARRLHPAICTGPPRGKAMTVLSPG